MSAMKTWDYDAYGPPAAAGLVRDPSTGRFLEQCFGTEKGRAKYESRSKLADTPYRVS